jgi:hypothetical protein
MIVACVCLAIGVLGAANVIDGVNVLAWVAGGLLAWAVDVTAGGYVFTVPARRSPPPS